MTYATGGVETMVPVSGVDHRIHTFTGGGTRDLFLSGVLNVY